MGDERQAVRTRIGKKVRQLRLLRGLSQERLAEMVGNERKHIGLVERGRVNVTIDILTAIASSLSVDVSELCRPSGHAARSHRTYTLAEPDVEQVEQALRAIARVRRTGR